MRPTQSTPPRCFNRRACLDFHDKQSVEDIKRTCKTVSWKGHTLAFSCLVWRQIRNQFLKNRFSRSTKGGQTVSLKTGQISAPLRSLRETLNWSSWDSKMQNCKSSLRCLWTSRDWRKTFRQLKKLQVRQCWTRARRIYWDKLLAFNWHRKDMCNSHLDNCSKVSYFQILLTPNK
jgi:hypothetical protein